MTHDTISPLKNVLAFSELVERTINRPAHLPGMATFTGFSGYGKTYAAIYARNQYDAIYIEAGDSWTRKKFCDVLLNELGMVCKGSIADKVDKIIEGLVYKNSVLIIDEFDFIVNKRFVELVREIHMKSDTPIILIGEELLPSKLAEWERFHNRILSFEQAQPADVADTVHLAKMYCEDIIIELDLIEHIHRLSQGRVRRICTNLQKIYEQAKLTGLDSISLKEMPVKRFDTGLPQARRAA